MKEQCKQMPGGGLWRERINQNTDATITGMRVLGDQGSRWVNNVRMSLSSQGIGVSNQT